MKGIRGVNRLLFIVIAAIVMGSCAKKPSEPSTPHVFVEPYETFEQFNDFPFSCDESLHTLAYIEKVHPKPKKDRKTLIRLRKSLMKILKKDRIPTPYFTRLEGIWLSNPVGFDIHYVELGMLDEETQQQLRRSVQSLDERSDLCAVVREFEVAFKPLASSEDSRILSHLKSLIHKSVLRYFVASLDPHSNFMENIEHQFIHKGMGRQVRRDADENYSIIRYSPENKYYQFPNGISMGASWLVNESDGEDDGILKVDIHGFDKNTAKNFRDLYLKIRKSHGDLKGLVIDLRKNRGGEAFVVAKLADLFVREGIVLSMQERTLDGWRHVKFEAKSGNELPGIDDLPVVILASRYSASSSETFMAAMQYHKKALIIGEKTFGKGTGQRIASMNKLPISGKVKSTAVLNMTQFYSFTPSGDPIQQVGITPDIFVDDFEYASPDVKKFFKNRSAYKDHFEHFIPHSLKPPAPHVWPTHRSVVDRPLLIYWKDFKKRMRDHFKKFGNIYMPIILADAFATASRR